MTFSVLYSADQIQFKSKILVYRDQLSTTWRVKKKGYSYATHDYDDDGYYYWYCHEKYDNDDE